MMLPAGKQITGRHHEDALLLEVALTAERSSLWALASPREPGQKQVLTRAFAAL